VIGQGKDRRHSEFYREIRNGKTYYVLPLSRDLEDDETAAIAHAWNAAYPDGDFIINTSQRARAESKLTELRSNKLAELAEAAAKQHHQRWFARENQRGWSYGPRYSESARHNPNLLPWDKLGPQARAQRTENMADLLQVLHEMKLKIVPR
jgi:hypothetical protein